jgi:hypothetical protein
VASGVQRARRWHARRAYRRSFASSERILFPRCFSGVKDAYTFNRGDGDMDGVPGSPTVQ